MFKNVSYRPNNSYKKPYRISLSNCSGFNVPSIASQSGLNTEYALTSPLLFGPVLVFAQIM